MPNLTNRALAAAFRIFSGEAGLKISLENVLAAQQQPQTEMKFLLERRLWGSKWTDRESESRLPRISFALTRLSSKGAEKLSRSSARATLEMAILLTEERASGVEEQMAHYVDAVIDVLDRNRGLWGSGVFYAGEFQVDIKPLAKGGVNYVQHAAFEIEIYLWQE